MIFVFDIDETICFDGVKIADDILSALTVLEKHGHQLVFASARPVRDMLPLLANFPENFLIGGNGSIVRKNGQIEIVKAIENSDFEWLRKFVISGNLDYLVDTDWDYALKNQYDEIANINQKIDQNHLAKNISLNEILQAIKFNILNFSGNEAAFNKLNVEIIHHENTKSLDITAKDINKYTTFRRCFPSENYIAFGNDANDVKLLKHATYSAAIGDNSALDFADEHLSALTMTQFLKEKKWQK